VVAWPSGAIDYDTSVQLLVSASYPDFLPGTSQQIDGHVQIHDVLT
jgi:hypothetical protein